MYQNYANLAMIPDAGIDNLGLFAEYELPLASKLVLKAGLRGDLTWAEAGKTNTLVITGTSENFANVSANLQLTYTPLKGLDIFTRHRSQHPHTRSAGTLPGCADSGGTHGYLPILARQPQSEIDQKPPGGRRREIFDRQVLCQKLSLL